MFVACQRRHLEVSYCLHGFTYGVAIPLVYIVFLGLPNVCIMKGQVCDISL